MTTTTTMPMTTKTTTKKPPPTKKTGYTYRPAFFSFANTRYGRPNLGPGPPNHISHPHSTPYTDQCYCPCVTYVTHAHKINKDPFEEQKILFDLERARGFSTESSVNTDLPDYYETTTFRDILSLRHHTTFTDAFIFL